MQQGAHTMQNNANAKQPALYVTMYVKVETMQQGIDLLEATFKTVRAMPHDANHAPGIYVVNQNNEAVY
jgi:hypothetical protein